MATLDELQAALQRADQAGDTEAATAIAKMYAEQFHAQGATQAAPDGGNAQLEHDMPLRGQADAIKTDLSAKLASGQITPAAFKNVTRNMDANQPARVAETMQGMTLGLGDEIGAGASALSNLVKGKPVGNAYSQNLDQTRQTLSQYGKDKPFSAAGLQAVGSLPISLIPGPSFFPKAQGLGGAMLAGGANAAAMGGAYGFNTGEDGPLSRLVNAAKVAVPSAVVGATVPALFQGAKSVGNAFVHGGGPSDAALAANEAGYVLPPNMASDQPSIASQGLNMAGGKLKTEYLASEKNQEVTNRLASEALGLSPDAQLTEKTFKDIRATAGKAYEAVKGVNIPIAFKPLSANDEAGQAFQDAVSNLSDISGAVRAEFPEHAANEGIDNLTGMLSAKAEASPAAIVDLTRSLRYKATSNLKNFGDPEKQALGIAQRRAADALDNILDARLSETGNAGLVDQYRSARQLIAMSHDVEAATNAAGDVNAKVLAGLANKGRPLSGNLETIANVASAFPRAMRDPATFGGMENLGILDMWGTAGATVAGHPGVGAALLSRPGARKIALSQPYQSLMMANRGVTAPSALGVMGSAPTAIGSDALLRLLSRQSLANPGN